MRRNHFASVLAFCVLAATALFAQVVITSTIVGTVTDPQGAGCRTRRSLSPTSTPASSGRRLTNASGDYQFANLIAGHYKVEVVKEGFAHTVSTAVALENGTTRRINLGLKMGQNVRDGGGLQRRGAGQDR